MIPWNPCPAAIFDPAVVSVTRSLPRTRPSIARDRTDLLATRTGSALLRAINWDALKSNATESTAAKGGSRSLVAEAIRSRAASCVAELCVIRPRSDVTELSSFSSNRYYGLSVKHREHCLSQRPSQIDGLGCYQSRQFIELRNHCHLISIHQPTQDHTVDDSHAEPCHCVSWLQPSDTGMSGAALEEC